MTMVRWLSILAFASCAVSMACAQSGTLVTANTLDHDGLTRYFHYYVPTGMGASPPLVILLHGGPRSYNKIISATSAGREWLAVADDEKFLLVIPNGVDPDTGLTDTETQHWNDCRSDDGPHATGADDVGFISALIDWSATNFAIDTQRVYVTGASNGGMMSYRLALELGHRVAAIAVFTANLPAVAECSGFVFPLPVFICNGDAETTFMPWNGGFVFDSTHGTVISALATRDFWINHNNTATTPSQVINYPNLDLFDGTTVSSARYTGGDEGSEVMFYTVSGGGHTTPSINFQLGIIQLAIVGPQSNDIEGTRHAWAFLSTQTLGTTKPPGLPAGNGVLICLVTALALSGALFVRRHISKRRHYRY